MVGWVWSIAYSFLQGEWVGHSQCLHKQIIWKTKWAVDKEYILEPGDLIKIPKNTSHEVKPLTARAGISFGIWKNIILYTLYMMTL